MNPLPRPGAAPLSLIQGILPVKIHTFVTDIASPRERGRRLGECWADEIGETLRRYLDFFPRVGIEPRRVRAIGEASLGALEAWSPELASEVMGLAAGAGVPSWQLASLNARTEVLAAMPSAVGECSTTVHAPPGPRAPLSLQTWDWHDSLTPHGLMLQFPGRGGHTVKLFTEFGMLGKIGVNGAGLGLHFNILHHQSDHAGGGVPVHAVARRLLEEATSVDEAIALARSAEVSASTVLTVFSRRDDGPRAASIELSPAGTGVVLPRTDGWLLHTNHFLDPGLSRGENTPDTLTTYARLAHLEDVVGGMGVAGIAERAAAMCGAAGDRAPICFHPDMSLPDSERWETLLTVGIDTEGGALEYAAGTPQALAEAGYARF